MTALVPEKLGNEGFLASRTKKPFWVDLTDSAVANTPMSVGQACRNQETKDPGCSACSGHLQAWCNLSAYLTGLS